MQETVSNSIAEPSPRAGLGHHLAGYFCRASDYVPHSLTRDNNALAEAFNATLKREVLQDRAVFADEASCRREVFRWLVRYNNTRRHSYLGYIAPVAFEAEPTAATLPIAA